MVAKYAGTKLCSFVARHIDMSEKSQKEIAEAIGYDKPNMLSMVKRGDTRLPIDKVIPLAKALGVDPAGLLVLTLGQYYPDEESELASLFATATTRNERVILQKIRNVTNGSDPEMTPTIERKLEETFAD